MERHSVVVCIDERFPKFLDKLAFYLGFNEDRGRHEFEFLASPYENYEGFHIDIDKLENFGLELDDIFEVIDERI